MPRPGPPAMTSEAVRKQIRGGEDLHTEFVKNPEHVEQIARTVCAFLNASGGTIFCGVDEKGGTVGISNPAAVRERLESKLQKLISPKALFTLNVEQDNGAAIIAIEVPEGKDRPYVVAGAVYIREGSVTRAANADALRSMVQVQAAAVDRWERRPSPALDYDDLDRAEIRATVTQASETSRLQFADPDDDLAVLRELSMITPTGFTQGADVVFARAPARRHPQCRIRLISFESDKGGDTYADNRWFEGPVVRAFESVFEAVRANVRTQSRFPAGEIRRRDRPDYPLEALREGLVNAIAHRDYSSFSGGLTVSIYPSRIEIWNSGRLPEELQVPDLRRNHPSIPTNPDIAHVLYLRNLMERVGRGTQKIIAACKELGAPAPKWSDKPTGVTLTLFAAGTAVDVGALNPRQEQLLRDLRAGDVVRAGDYAAQYARDVTERQARRDLNDLEDAGLLEREGAARSTAYRRTEAKWS